MNRRKFLLGALTCAAGAALLPGAPAVKGDGYAYYTTGIVMPRERPGLVAVYADGHLVWSKEKGRIEAHKVNKKVARKLAFLEDSS